MTPHRPLPAARPRPVSACALVIAASLALLAGCNSRAPAVEPVVEPTAPQGPWFCEPAIGADGWRCVDTPALVANPRPSRPLSIALAEAQAAADARSATDANPAAGLAATVTGSDGAAGTDATLIEIGDSTMTTTVTRLPTSNPAALTDQPAQRVSLLALPPEYYVVQLATLNSPSRLQEVVSELGDRSLMAARIDADGELRYALLLGVYENFAAAEQAAASVPATFDRLEPWVRRLGSLQAAILRAEQQRE